MKGWVDRFLVAWVRKGLGILDYLQCVPIGVSRGVLVVRERPSWHARNQVPVDEVYPFTCSRDRLLRTPGFLMNVNDRQVRAGILLIL